MFECASQVVNTWLATAEATRSEAEPVVYRVEGKAQHQALVQDETLVRDDAS